MRRIAMIVFALLLVMVQLAGCGRSDDIFGHWKAEITLPETGKSLTGLEVVFTGKGRGLSGVINFTKVPGGSLPLSGEFSGNRLCFVSAAEKGLKISFSGSRKSPGLIEGIALLDYKAPQLDKKKDRVRMVLSR